jgi:death on curing protein
VKEPIWVGREFVLVIHEELLAEFGGSAGVRDEGLLDSALGKAQNLFAYSKPTIFDLAASYAVGIVRNHPFIDGNKRTGFIVAYTFLVQNGHELRASEAEAAAAVLALAGNEMSEAMFSLWLKENSMRSGRK